MVRKSRADLFHGKPGLREVVIHVFFHQEHAVGRVGSLFLRAMRGEAAANAGERVEQHAFACQIQHFLRGIEAFPPSGRQFCEAGKHGVFAVYAKAFHQHVCAQANVADIVIGEIRLRLQQVRRPREHKEKIACAQLCRLSAAVQLSGSRGCKVHAIGGAQGGAVIVHIGGFIYIIDCLQHVRRGFCGHKMANVLLIDNDRPPSLLSLIHIFFVKIAEYNKVNEEKGRVFHVW